MAEICTKCSQPKDNSSQGSITQWVFVCRCDLVLPKDDSPESSVCKKCGKIVLTRRDGSMTQWIFRPDSCRCKSPSVPGQLEETTALKNENLKEQEKELELSADEFPVERYKPIEYLGRGASGEVILCQDRKLNKKVAVKKLHSPDDSVLIQFQNEARMISKLKHSNIIQILDFGVTEGGFPFMVLEYVDGLSLATFLDENNNFSQQDSCFIISEICNALSQAHESGIMHRDINPTNVLIVPQDNKLQIKVIDFGIAKIKESMQEKEGGAITIAGSPFYMSADQASGLEYTPQSEIYSIGCLFFKLITGKVPFEADTALETISLHAHQKAPSIKETANIDVPYELERIIAKCLEKESDNRYQSVDQLAQDLKVIMSSDQLLDSDFSEPEPIVRPRKNQLPLTLISLTSVIFLAFVTLILWKIIDKPKTVYKKLDTVPLRGVFRDLGDEKGKFTQGTDDEGRAYTFPLDFMGLGDEDLKMLKDKRIRNLALWNCPINGSGLKYLKNVPLEKINLSGSHIEDKNLAYLKEIPTLESIRLEQTVTSASGIKLIGHSSKVKALYLKDCSHIDDSAVNLIVNQFPNLEILVLNKTETGSNGFKLLNNLTRLKSLGVGSTSFSDTDAKSVTKFPLIYIHINHTSVSDEGLMELAKIKTLKEISFSGCKNVTADARKSLVKKRPDLRIVPGED